MLYLPPKVKRLKLPLLILLVLVPIFLFSEVVRSIPYVYRHNYLLAKTPLWAHVYMRKLNIVETFTLARPQALDSLLQAKYMGDWHIRSSPSPILKLHIFSEATTEARSRRSLIRQYSPLLSIPRGYRHLVEMRFVIDHPFVSDPTSKTEQEEEWEVNEETMRYGDIVRLEGAKDRDKTLDWIRYVGREEGTEAWWVMKCSDDTIPILPNLLPYLLSLDPHVPTYLGSALCHWPGFHYHFEGSLYGLSWGVTKTIASATLNETLFFRQLNEDARLGELVYSLPSRPIFRIHPYPDPPLSAYLSPPPSPDPRTGLVRLDIGNSIGRPDHPWSVPRDELVAYTGFENDEDYLVQYGAIIEAFEENGRDFVCAIPPDFEPVVEADGDQHTGIGERRY
ncbi:hypothetical protein P7C73_g702, partial [Tremellales sp. Uapishka_1]